MELQKVTPRVIATVWKHWLPSFKASKYALFGSVLFISLSVFIDLMYKPTQVKLIFDSLSHHTSPWIAFKHIFIAAIVGWFVSRLAETCIVFGESKIIKDLKDYCMQGLLGKSSEFYTSHSFGGLVAKSKRFAHVSESVLDEFIFMILRSVLLIAYIILYSWILIPELTPIFVTWVVVFITITVILSRWRMRFDLKSSQADSITTSHVSDILLSIITLRVFSAIPKVKSTFEDVTESELKKRKISWFFGNLQWAIQATLVAVLELYCLHLMISKVELNIYSIGTLALVQAYIASLTMYMYGFGRSLIKIRTAFADAYEMAELLSEKSNEPIHFDEEHLIPQNNGISITDVTFGYDEGEPALHNFSFKFLPGRRYGVVGKTGAGKSTLAKLVLRLFDQTDGHINVCNVDTRDINKLILRSWISYVPQDPQFPSWSIRDIISMGKSHATIEEIEDAARKASCDFIFEKPNGFETIIGERGIKLSGGERQRLAIAAAILKDAPIFIMDEPTSALDAETEQVIQQVIKNEFKGKTLIIVAHRLSTVAILDEVILLNNGNVEDCGPHESLLKTSSTYNRMWELQTNPQFSDVLTE